MHDGGVPESARLAGIVTSAELAAAGASAAAVRTLVRRGVLMRLGSGVYAPALPAAEAAATRAGEHALRVAARLARGGPGAVASHRSAAIIHGLDLLGRTPNGVELTCSPGAASRTWRGGVHVHAAALPASHVTLRHGVPLTSVARTVVDLARALTFPAAVVTADSVLRSRLSCRGELESVVAACARWKHVRRASRVVAFADGRSESALESLARAVFHEHELPPPDLQAWVGNEYEIIGRADFLWSAFRTVGEADGALKYAGPARALAQLRRDAQLRDAGFEIVHFTWAEIQRSPDQVVAALKRAFHRGALRRSPG
jgi:hypothetical protein